MEKFAEKRKNVGLNLIDWKFVFVQEIFTKGML